VGTDQTKKIIGWKIWSKLRAHQLLLKLRVGAVGNLITYLCPACSKPRISLFTVAGGRAPSGGSSILVDVFSFSSLFLLFCFTFASLSLVLLFALLGRPVQP
jgi:hypothetical protein